MYLEKKNKQKNMSVNELVLELFKRKILDIGIVILKMKFELQICK